MKIKIGNRFRDKETDVKATVKGIFTAYPHGVETTFLEAKFDDDRKTYTLSIEYFNEFYEIIK
jgi:hypothetical protein